MNNWKFFLSLSLAVLLLIPFFAIGKAFRVNLLPDKGKNFGCGTCHVNLAGGGALNAFGKDWNAIAIPKGDQYVDELGNRDSDGDGFKNSDEFNAGTNPGDPNSKPQQNQAVTPKSKLSTFWGKVKFRI